MTKGRFITIEGGDGAGKSTQTAAIVACLEKRNIKVITTREVGGAPGAEVIRDVWLKQEQGYWDPITELFLIMAARREHLTKTVWPALEVGTWVISDRFVDSTRAYQGIGLELGLKVIDEAYKQIAGDFWPDKTLVLDLPVEVGLQRREERNGQGDRYEAQDAAFHNKLRQAFLDLATDEPNRFSVIDATQEPTAVSVEIEKALAPLFETKS